MVLEENFVVSEIDLHNFSQTIEVAAIGQPLSGVSIEDQLHSIDLDIIGAITAREFKSLFYYRDGENFGVNPNAVLNDHSKSLISFSGQHRTTKLGDASFNLIESIFENLEGDLGVKRECFDLCSRIELTKELSHINTLVDIESCVVLCSLKWTDITKLLKQKSHQLGHTLIGSYVDNKGTVKDAITHVLNVSVIFKNPNPKTMDTMVRFKYAVLFGENDI